MDLLVPLTTTTIWPHYQNLDNILNNNHLSFQTPPQVSYNTGTGLHPNAKLERCCQKQGISTSCQTLCNFDTFTDRTVCLFLIMY